MTTVCTLQIILNLTPPSLHFCIYVVAIQSYTHLLLISASDIIVTSWYCIMYYIFAGVSLYNGWLHICFHLTRSCSPFLNTRNYLLHTTPWSVCTMYNIWLHRNSHRNCIHCRYGNQPLTFAVLSAAALYVNDAPASDSPWLFTWPMRWLSAYASHELPRDIGFRLGPSVGKQPKMIRNIIHKHCISSHIQ